MTNSERSLANRANAYDSWAKTADRTARTNPGRATFLNRFEREVDPDGVLPVQERAQRAEYARKAYFTRLALKSVRARRIAKEMIEAADAAETEIRTGGDAA